MAGRGILEEDGRGFLGGADERGVEAAEVGRGEVPEGRPISNCISLGVGLEEEEDRSRLENTASASFCASFSGGGAGFFAAAGLVVRREAEVFAFAARRRSEPGGGRGGGTQTGAC